MSLIILVYFLNQTLIEADCVTYTGLGIMERGRLIAVVLLPKSSQSNGGNKNENI